MRPASAARLSRVLVGCYPRRWRERYRQEMLDVLDQHPATARTVLNLAAGVLSTHLDPAYRAEGLSTARLRRAAATSAAIAAPLAVIVVLFGVLILAKSWKEGHWHVGQGGVTAMAFSPADQHMLVTATSGSQDGLDTLWDVTDPAGPGAWPISRAERPRRSHQTAARWRPSRSTASRPCGMWPTPASRPR